MSLNKTIVGVLVFLVIIGAIGISGFLMGSVEGQMTTSSIEQNATNSSLTILNIGMSTTGVLGYLVAMFVIIALLAMLSKLKK